MPRVAVVLPRSFIYARTGSSPNLKAEQMKIKAIAFDTGGTVLDWHSGLVGAMARASEANDIAVDCHAAVNDWRRRAMKGIVGQVQPAFNMDDVHRITLDETLAAFGLGSITLIERQAILHAWHQVATWSDFPPALHRLRQLLPVVSLTMLPTALVVDVSRKNGFHWDAIISCEMIGVYKPHAQAYLTAARWLAMQPADILMVACHNFDLNAAHAAGFRTAFVRRPDEWGPAGPPDPKPNMDYDFVEDDFAALASQIERRLGSSA
jgi:2-haloacid dehalogenase